MKDIFEKLMTSAVEDKVKNDGHLNSPRFISDNIHELNIEECWQVDERCDSAKAYEIFESVKCWTDTTYLSARNVMLTFKVNKNTAKKVRKLFMEHRGLLKKKGRRPGEKKEFTVKSEAVIRKIASHDFKIARQTAKMIDDFNRNGRLLGYMF